MLLQEDVKKKGSKGNMHHKTKFQHKSGGEKKGIDTEEDSYLNTDRNGGDGSWVTTQRTNKPIYEDENKIGEGGRGVCKGKSEGETSRAVHQNAAQRVDVS